MKYAENRPYADPEKEAADRRRASTSTDGRRLAVFFLP
jgi:hypothetical protein